MIETLIIVLAALAINWYVTRIIIEQEHKKTREWMKRLWKQE
jgi:hypothetical protein